MSCRAPRDSCSSGTSRSTASRRVEREELLTAVYGEEASRDHRPRLSVVLSKLRRVVRSPNSWSDDQRSSSRCRPTFVDVEAALEALHRAEFHVANGEWAKAWGRPALPTTWPAAPCFRVTTVAGWTSGAAGSTTFDSAGSSASQWRGSASADRRCRRPKCGRRLIELAPYRETGHRILMEALERRGGVAEALRALRPPASSLRDELGTAPGPAVQSVYRRLLDEARTTA